jgi:glucosamine kinase
VTRVLGLDIGASTTRARLVADGVIEAEARAASASITAAGPDRAAAGLTELLAQLPELTGSLDAVCAGAAGVVTAPETRDFLRARLVPLTSSGRVVVVDDVSLVLPAAGLTDGIAVVSGTGSIAAGSWQGSTALAGGWGYLLGDEGSGYWIVRSAIRELLARLGSDAPPGPLGACLLNAAGARDLTQLRGMFYRQP